MAKREISSTLKNLKFMQRAAQREEKSKQVEEVVPSGNFSPSGIVKKCIVIMEGDPHPGLSRGRMSFQSFNPSIDNLNEEANTPSQPETSTPLSGNQNGKSFVRSALSPSSSFLRLSSVPDKLTSWAFPAHQAKMVVSWSRPAKAKVPSNSVSIEDESTQNGHDSFELNRSSNSANGDLKRKQPEVASETPSPNKSKKNFQSAPEAHRGNRNLEKQPKGQKLDWSVLRPPKGQKKTE